MQFKSICHYFIEKTWILTNTNSSGSRKQDIFFFLPLPLITRSNIAAIFFYQYCPMHYKTFIPSDNHIGRFGIKIEPVNSDLLLPIWGEGEAWAGWGEVKLVCWKRRLASGAENIFTKLRCVCVLPLIPEVSGLTQTGQVLAESRQQGILHPLIWGRPKGVVVHNLSLKWSKKGPIIN